MEYKIQFGSLNSSPTPAAERRSFRIAVLGDFSANGNRGRVDVGEALASRKPLRVTHENLDALLERLAVQLNLPAGPSGAMMDVPIRSLDDFHPDQLYENVPIFEKLVSLRSKLQDSATFSKAAAAVRSLVGDPDLGVVAPSVRTSASSVVPRGRIESFADLIGSHATTRQEPELKALLRDVVGAHIVADMQGQAELIAAVDASLSDLMRRVLHHPDFQALESLWRSLDFILHRLELDGELEIVLYDLNAQEFAADLASSDNLEETGLYRWLVEMPALDAQQGPLSLLLCNFMFELIPPHAELLARATQIAAAAGAAMLASVDRSCIKKEAPEDIHPLITQTWQALRQMPQAGYLALTTPRFMLRWPYGKKTEPIESFAFEEFTPKSGLNGMLWGNSAFLAGLVIGQTFLNDGLSAMKLGSVLTIDDLPFYYFTDADGDQIALPCSERLINVRTSQYVSSQGFIPVLAMQGRPEVRLGGLQAVSGTPLAGPWNLLELATDSSAAPLTNPVAAPEPMAAEATPSTADDDELDALLAAIDEPAATPDAAAADSAADDDLDNLLASLDTADAANASAGAEADVDADLAALLADL